VNEKDRRELFSQENRATPAKTKVRPSSQSRKGQNARVKPEGTIRQHAKSLEKQAFFAVPSIRIRWKYE
jgi:hypothetical protein